MESSGWKTKPNVVIAMIGIGWSVILTAMVLLKRRKQSEVPEPVEGVEGAAQIAGV